MPPLAKKIKLTGILGKDKFALVDADMYAELSKLNWSLSNSGYPIRHTHIGSKKDNTRKGIYFFMHRLINKTPDGFDTDHINGNKLDNRCENLRTATRQQNMINTGLPHNNTSGFKGVTWDKSRGKWSARIKVNKKHINLGRFTNIQGAWLARRLAERLYWGEISCR